MKIAKVYGRAQQGLSAPTVSIEVHISNGLPSLSIVGLAETAVKESKDRVRSAIINSHFDFPAQRITINLAPADLPKSGSHYDLAIAIGILAASKQIPANILEQFEFIGELALDGGIRQVSGLFALAIASKQSARQLFFPAENVHEIELIQDLIAFKATHLLEVTAHIKQSKLLEPLAHIKVDEAISNSMDMAEVKGHYQAKRALEIAACGKHHILMLGPPGTGKTMLASRFPGILPRLNEQQAIEVASIHSLKNVADYIKHFYEPPFRRPHHTASAIAVAGGGAPPKPGEVSLAHHGVLFLDETPEFSRQVLEVLREPLESKQIHISRARAEVTYPADFQLIAAMNPCPCGYYGMQNQSCQCSQKQIQHYRSKLSGPLLDRIDIHIELAWQDPKEWANDSKAIDSQNLRKKISQVREKQLNRQGMLNGELNSRLLSQFCQLSQSNQGLLEDMIRKLGLSFRSYSKILKLARSIADLADVNQIEHIHLMEAMQYQRRHLL